MRSFGVITAWMIIAALICGFSSMNDYSMVVSIENYLMQLLIPLMSLNMMVCASIANSLFKYEERHNVEGDKISALVGEMRQSVIAQLVGIVVIVLIKSVCSVFNTVALEFIYHTLSMSVLVMYVWLIFDMALAYFRMIEGEK